MYSFGQDPPLKPIPDWQRKVNKILIKEKSSYVLKDSIAIYTYNFKLKILRSKKGMSRVEQVLVTDTLLYKLFPNYKELYAINYSSLLGIRNEVNLVIPVLVYSVSPTGKSKYLKQDSQPLVSIESAMAISQQSLISLMPKDIYEDVVLMKPVVIKILNLE